jgi:hypothetical protein
MALEDDPDIAADTVPTALYRQARNFLMVNEPLRGFAKETSVAGSLSASEVIALESVGLSVAPWTKGQDRDPLMESIADYMALLATRLTTAEAAALLKVDVSRVRQRLREGSLLGVDYDGERRLPRFQFERGLVLPGLREVLAALPGGLNPLDVAEWILSPNPDLESDRDATPLSPREWLLNGGAVDRVVVLALGFA